MPPQIDRARLKKITRELVDAITSPEVLERMKKFRTQAARGATFDAAGDIMSLESLRAAGADLPADFRLTSRVFEDRERGIKFEIRPPVTDLPGGQVSWGACAGGGAATVCGCAGGST